MKGEAKSEGAWSYESTVSREHMDHIDGLLRNCPIREVRLSSGSEVCVTGID